MNILEFIGSLEALPSDVIRFSRDKVKLASRFGLVEGPTSLPYDVIQTRIPDRAIDGYMAKHVLSHPGLPDEIFADYAFTACAIFAAQQMSIRSGIRNRRLDVEYSHFIAGSLAPCLTRIVGALNDTPLLLNYWTGETRKDAHDAIWNSLNRLAIERAAMKQPTEQACHYFECSTIGGIAEKFAEVFQAQVPAAHGKIGLLVMSNFVEIDKYILAFDHFQSRLSDLAVVLIYDSSDVVDEVCSALVSRHLWRGIALKKLAYQKEIRATDFALLALQANLFHITEI